MRRRSGSGWLLMLRLFRRSQQRGKVCDGLTRGEFFGVVGGVGGDSPYVTHIPPALQYVA
jgi:hypothetical protein